MQWDGQEKRRAWCRHSGELRQRFFVVDVLDDVERSDEIERGVGAWKTRHEPDGRIGPPLDQLCDGGCADVDETGSGDG